MPIDKGNLTANLLHKSFEKHCPIGLLFAINGELFDQFPLRDDVHTHFVTLIVKWTIVGGWVKPLDDKGGKVGTIKSPKNLG